MVEFKPGMLSRVLTTFKRWFSVEEGRVALPAMAQAAPARWQVNASVDAPPARDTLIAVEANAPHEPAVPRETPAFHLPARLHSVAKLNPRKDRSKSPVQGKRAGKPVTVSQPVVRSGRDTRHVWLKTRAVSTVGRSAGATIHQLPAPKASSRPRKAIDVRRAA